MASSVRGNDAALPERFSGRVLASLTRPRPDWVVPPGGAELKAESRKEKAESAPETDVSQPGPEGGAELKAETLKS